MDNIKLRDLYLSKRELDEDYQNKSNDSLFKSLRNNQKIKKE